MAAAKSKCHCGVPHCKTNKQRQPYLSFHGFPSDITERKKWVQAIRRDEGQDFTILRGSTFVCSRHFNEADYTPATGRKRLKIGAVPCRFHWNNWEASEWESVNDRATTALGDDVHPDLSLKECKREDLSPEATAEPSHDYTVAPTPDTPTIQQHSIQSQFEDPVLFDHNYVQTISFEKEDSHQMFDDFGTQEGPSDADSGHRFLMDNDLGLQLVDLPKPAINTEKMQLRSEPAAHDLALIRLEEYKEQIKELEEQCRIEEERALKNIFCLQRFAGSDDGIQFYTRFASYKHFMAFWKLVEPATDKMILPSSRKKVRVKVLAIPGKLPLQTLQPIDEFFLFMVHLALGLEPLDLATLFHIKQFTANEIINTWANFLYLFLGSVGIWMSKDYAKAHLPEEFNKFPDTQVVISCIDVRCQTSSILLEENEMFTDFKPFCILKAMVGMTPNGVVTFVSKLYPKSISNRQLFIQSGIIPLLTSDMAIMVDKSFRVRDLVQCKVHHPVFLSKLQHVTVGRVKPSRLRLHVEKTMQRLGAHELFNKVIPLSVAGTINQLFSVACQLVNYQGEPKALVDKMYS